ncbi:hypothetical protein ES703_125815 [subsurface metagenome]
MGTDKGGEHNGCKGPHQADGHIQSHCRRNKHLVADLGVFEVAERFGDPGRLVGVIGMVHDHVTYQRYKHYSSKHRECTVKLKHPGHLGFVRSSCGGEVSLSTLPCHFRVKIHNNENNKVGWVKNGLSCTKRIKHRLSRFGDKQTIEDFGQGKLDQQHDQDNHYNNIIEERLKEVSHKNRNLSANKSHIERDADHQNQH